jgi:hypothetical protein
MRKMVLKRIKEKLDQEKAIKILSFVAVGLISCYLYYNQEEGEG